MFVDVALSLVRALVDGVLHGVAGRAQTGGGADIGVFGNSGEHVSVLGSVESGGWWDTHCLLVSLLAWWAWPWVFWEIQLPAFLREFMLKGLFRWE